MKHLLKTLLLPITALTIVFAFIACDGENAPDVKYSVTYVIGEDAQGTAPEETKKAVGEKFIIKSADGITNGNLTFMGWSDGNIIYQAGEEYTMPTKAVTFTAQWEDTSCIPVTYTVTYDLNGGTGKVPTESNKEKGEKFKLASADGLKNGDLYFYGWSDGTKVYDAGAEYTMPDKAVTFTAQWDGCTEPPNEWTVTYDLNGGSGTLPTESDKIKGEKFKLASADGLKNGDKIFDGWSDGTKVYDAGAEYEMPEDHVTFTAQWKDKPVQANIIYVAYDLDFQGIISLYDNNLVVLDYIDASEESQTAVFSYTLSGTAIAITIDEDTFDGTYENELLTIQITYANTVFKFGPKEEKPKGKPTVEFSANGGTGDAPVIADDAFAYVESANKYRFKLPENTYTAPDGKEFKGWNINDQKDALDNLIVVNVNATYMADPEEKITIKPLWKDVEVPVTKGIEFIGECTLPEKKVFGGTQGGETVVKIIIDKSDADNLKIYYKLKNDDAEYASKNVAPNRYLPKEVYGEDALYYDLTIENVLYTVVIKADFTRLTLCDQTDDEPLDNGEFVVSGSVENPPEETDEVTVTFDLGYVGGTAISSQKLENGGKAVAPETPTRDGYVFGGWHLGVASGEEFDFDTAVTTNITLVAKWLKEYTVAYAQPDGVTGEAPEEQTVVEGAQVLLPAECPFTKAGWTFSGWAVTGYSALRASNTKITVTQNTTITAVFSVVYSGALGDYTLRDNGTGADEEDEAFTYTRNGDIVTIVEYMLALKVNDTDKTYDLQDGMQNFTFTAANNTTLTFDGFGAATLGTHSGTYTVLSNTTFTLIIGDDTYSAIELNGEYPNITIDVKITIDGTDYVFGNNGTNPNPPDDNPIIGNKLSDYAGDSEANGVWYGYDSAESAGNNAVKIETTVSTTLLFKFNIYWGKNGGVDCIIVKRYYNSTNATAAVLINGDKVTDPEESNTAVYFSASGKKISLEFSVNNDGKRQITITVTDNNTGSDEGTYIWTEMSA